MKVIHIIVGLNIGGAENMLRRLLIESLSSGRYEHEVISLTDIGEVGQMLRHSGVRVSCLDMSSILSIPRVFFKLIRVMHNNRHAVVQTWMYHADLLGGLASIISGNRRVVWNIRGTYIPQEGISLTGVVIKFCKFLSHKVPAKIICCSEVARNHHISLGYSQNNMEIIPNGYRIGDYSTNGLRSKIRGELSIENDAIVVGTIGRLDPLKDYGNFMSAALKVIEKHPNVKFLMVGRGLEKGGRQLKKVTGFDFDMDNFILLGERRNVNRYLEAMDIYCMSSSSEGFPNAVCEAMAMRVPCVSTDAGDAKNIVSSTGLIVPTKNYIALAEALNDMISLKVSKRLDLGTKARMRIENNYSIDYVLRRYEKVYEKL